MPDCDRIGEIMTDAQMKDFTKCKMPMGTVRWSGEAPRASQANIVTRLGVEDDDSTPYPDWITDTHFYLVDSGIRKEGTDIIGRQVASQNAPLLVLFYRRGTGKHFQYLGPIQFEAKEEHNGFEIYKFKRLCPTQIKHAR